MPHAVRAAQGAAPASPAHPKPLGLAYDAGAPHVIAVRDRLPPRPPPRPLDVAGFVAGLGSQQRGGKAGKRKPAEAQGGPAARAAAGARVQEGIGAYAARSAARGLAGQDVNPRDVVPLHPHVRPGPPGHAAVQNVNGVHVSERGARCAVQGVCGARALLQARHKARQVRLCRRCCCHRAHMRRCRAGLRPKVESCASGSLLGSRLLASLRPCLRTLL